MPLGVSYGVNQHIKRILVAFTQADEFIDLDDLVTTLCFMDNYSVTVSVHAEFMQERSFRESVLNMKIKFKENETREINRQ